MTGGLHYKDDSTFTRYLVMASVGELAAIDIMRRHGHDFKLDGLGAGSARVFKDKNLKRKRTADLRCAKCGQKLEVRSKSKLAIRMSHSADRPFDSEFDEADWVGFLQVGLSSPNIDPVDPASYKTSSSILVVSIRNLSGSSSLAEPSRAKSVSDGSESYLTWPSLVAPVDGIIKGIHRKNPTVYGDKSRISVSTNGEVRMLYPPAGSYLTRGLSVGSPVRAGETLLSSVIRPLTPAELRCKVSLTSK